MTTRRKFLQGGLGALAIGMLGNKRLLAAAGRARELEATGSGAPLLVLPDSPDSIVVDGLPFARGYTGDAYRDPAIPFHFFQPADPPPPSEFVDVAVVGGGLSGLATAYLLRDRNPVVFEFRDRFGGSAQGESWSGIPFSLGSAYVIWPDEDSFLEQFYTELGLDRVFVESGPPDPMEVGGKILDEFWSGRGLPASEQRAVEAYARVVRRMAGDAYPEIPLPDDPAAAQRVLALDGVSFRQDVEQQMGMPLTPLLAAGVQAYFYSSFCAGMDEISAAAGWNFVAAEEYGRWVFPGGNAFMAQALHDRLLPLDEADPASRPHLRAGSRVVDVRLVDDGALVTSVDARNEVRSLHARHVVMAGSKHIVKHILRDLDTLDPEKLGAIEGLEEATYLVANVLLDAPVEKDLFDVFLIGDDSFPMDPGDLLTERPVVDVLRGDYTDQNPGGRSVLTLYWPLPFPAARALLLLEGYEAQLERLVPQIRTILGLLDVPHDAVRQVRLTRWGHAVPIARPGFIAQGDAERLRRPLGDRIHFVNQDNWALPAVENSVLDAHEVAQRIERALGPR